MCKSTFFHSYPDGLDDSHYGFYEGTIPFHEFKSRVLDALRNKFGSYSVKVRNKSVKIESNTYHVDADVVPAFQYRDYRRIGSRKRDVFTEGIKLHAENGSTVINYPKIHLSNGIEKNKATNPRYKNLVRIVKRIRNNMVDDGVINGDIIGSFLVECLVWNFFLRWAIDGFVLNTGVLSVAYQFWSYAGEAILFTTILMFVYERWVWRRINVLKIPILAQKYKGKIIFSRDGNKEERVAEMDGKQTLLSVQVRFRTNESCSHSIHTVIDDNNGYPRLLYYYLNEPDSNIRDVSSIHYGHASLDLSNPEKLKGLYFTDRNTRGTIIVEAEKT